MTNLCASMGSDVVLSTEESGGAEGLIIVHVSVASRPHQGKQGRLRISEREDHGVVGSVY